MLTHCKQNIAGEDRVGGILYLSEGDYKNIEITHYRVRK